jgi:hypothetical protein
MPDKVARADVAHLRQTTQFTCCATSITSALHALGKKYTEDDVNKVLGASPMAGATWEAMLATVQYFGCRGTLVVPATPRMLKEWTDQGIPVVIAWNPEGRPWSHASTVFDVTEDENGKLTVYVMDSNIPNPDETVRVMDADTFCQKWGEKVSDTLIVRRPAMAVTLEVSQAGRQMVASTQETATPLPPWDWKPWAKVVADWFEENVGDRPKVSVTAVTWSGPTPYYDVSFILPAGQESTSAYRRWVNDDKVIRRWRSFKKRWARWGLTTTNSGDTGFRLTDGTFVKVMALGFGSNPSAVKVAAAHDLRPGEFEVGDRVRATGNMSVHMGVGQRRDVTNPSGWGPDFTPLPTTGKVVKVDASGAFKGWPRVMWDDGDGEPKVVHPANLLHMSPSRRQEVIENRLKTASMQRHCAIYLASDGNWYLELGEHEHDEYEDSVTYGPFATQRAAEKHLDQFSNPGGIDEDDSGDRRAPTRSPNGSPIRKPSSGGRWASDAFDWRELGKDLREALARTPVPPKMVTGEEYTGGVRIYIQFNEGYQYSRRWSTDRLFTTINTMANRHGLKKRSGIFIAPDGRLVEIVAMSVGGDGLPTGWPQRLIPKERRCAP